jgi:hypothetical protein
LRHPRTFLWQKNALGPTEITFLASTLYNITVALLRPTIIPEASASGKTVGVDINLRGV